VPHLRRQATVPLRDSYARWPRQGKDDFDTAWQKKYTGGWDNTSETKDYFERLTLELRKAYHKLKKPILMVPVGHVMYGLNQWMKAGRVPGYTDVKQLFADGIRLKNVGSYFGRGPDSPAFLACQVQRGRPAYLASDDPAARISRIVAGKVF
jgi:hypothetical protein